MLRTLAAASAYHPPAAYYGYHPPATAAYYGTACYNCVSTGGRRSRRRRSRHGRWRRRSLFQVPAPKARAPTMQATQPARPTRTLLTPTLRLPTLMPRRRTPMLPLRTLMSPLPMRVSLRAPPTSRIRWAPLYGALPAGCISPNVSGGGTYYLCGNTWFSPSYGANGVLYRVVPTP